MKIKARILLKYDIMKGNLRLSPLFRGVNVRFFIPVLALILSFGTVEVFPQSPDSLLATSTVTPPGDTAIVSIMLHNTQFSVGGFTTRFVLTDSVNASIQRIERGADVQDFDHFNVNQSDGVCKIVGIVDLPGGNHAPPLPIGLNELARVFIFIEDTAPWGLTDSILFMDDTLPPERDNSISDSTGYINEIPTLVGGEILFDVEIGADEDLAGMPKAIELYQNYPNPFNAETKIRFELSTEADRVSVAIYDIAGRRVAGFHWNGLPPGRHELVWNGVDDEGRPLASGVYFYRLEAGSWPAVTKRMTLLK
jgi:hypothetical protein